MQILSYLGFPESDDPHSIADTAYIICDQETLC